MKDAILFWHERRNFKFYADDTKKTISKCKELNTDFILVLHGGFTMGDVALTFAESNFKLGFWSVPEPTLTGDVQLNNFVSLSRFFDEK